MNTRTKGNRYELRARKELEADGYAVIRAPPATKWNREVDFFGLFDLIAVKKGEKRFIQVKANQLPGSKKHELEEFYETYLNDTDTVEWWCYWERGKRKTKQGWEKLMFNNS